MLLGLGGNFPKVKPPDLMSNLTARYPDPECCSHERMFWLIAMCVNFPELPSQRVLALLAGLALASQLLGQGPSDRLNQADADYRQGVAALNRNDLQTAHAKFAEVVRLAPSAEQGHSALGAVLEREGQIPGAIAELQKALAIKPDDAAAQLNLAAAYEQTGDAAKAVPLYARAVASARAQKLSVAAGVLASYAHALAATGQGAAAIERMKEAVAGQPGNVQQRDDLGTLYAQARDWPHAEQAFYGAIRLKPEFAAAHLHLGFVFQAEQKPEAVQEWLEAYKLEPGNASLALLVGKALADAGQDEQALPILEHAHALAAQSTDAAYQLSLALQRMNRVEEAISLLKSVIAAEPHNADALINLGLALSQAHEARDAVPFLERAIHLQPDNPTAHQDLAAAYLQVNETDAAIVELEAALKLSPDSPQLHYNLGAAYKIEDDAAHAIPELETAAKLDATAYEPQYLLGVLYMQQARYEEAAPRLEASLKMHPQNGDGWATLGSVYNKLDRLPEAVTALQQAIKQIPEQADPHLTLAAVLVKQNQAAQAAEERKTAANLMRAHMNYQRAEVATNSGKSLLKDGRLEDAVVEFRNAISFDPEYAEAHTGLASALQKQGKAAEAAAERACAKAIENPAPDSQDAQGGPAACAKQ
jgi:tetratricopeptide (TPR) repeat protein